MKILIATDTYKPVINGVVTSILNLISGLEALGHEVRVLALSNTIHSYSENNIYFIGSYDMGMFYPNIRVKRKLAIKEVTEIIEWHPDVIHTQSEFSTFYIARKISKKLSIPIVHTYHTMYEEYTHYFSPSKRVGKKAVSTGTNYVGNRVSCMVAPTEKIKKLVIDYGVACPVEVIPSGVSLEKFQQEISDIEIQKLKDKLNITKKDIVLLSVSRVGKEKNLDEIIKYMDILKEKHFSLVIVGDGPYKSELENLVSELNLNHKIKFTGMVSPKEVPLYYKLSDVFVSASTSETQGLTYIEALASGTPILCRQDDCLQNVLQEGINGYSFENEQEFVDNLQKITHLDTLNSMSKAALNSAEVFSILKFAKNAQKLYEKCINQMFICIKDSQ